MPKIQFKGIDEFVDDLEKVKNSSRTLCKRACYDGAAVVIEEIKAAIDTIPTQKKNPGKGQALVSAFPDEVEDLKKHIGIARMRDDNGKIQTKIGFFGYNRMKSKKYPSGHPNTLIARAINSGSSVRVKYPFISKAMKNAKKRAESAMQNRFTEDINEIMK